jgi:hypothetical protein
VADGSASGSALIPARVLPMCAPCLLECLALADLERFPPSSHIQRLGFCSRASSTRDTPQRWGQSKTRTGHRPAFSVVNEEKLLTPLRHPDLIMAEFWRGVGRVIDGIRTLLTMPLKLRGASSSMWMASQCGVFLLEPPPAAPLMQRGLSGPLGDGWSAHDPYPGARAGKPTSPLP